MLTQLFINNIAVIERVSLDFHKGFTVLTGETGAGKSIIIDAIHAVLGERTSKELIRFGADTANVTALFTEVSEQTLQKAQELGVIVEDDSLLISREIKSGGKSFCRVNGMPATVSMLKEIGNGLIGMHGQHETYSLLSEQVHLAYIDSFANTAVLLRKYQTSFDRLKELQKMLQELDTDEQQKQRKIDLLKYQIEEITLASLVPGEQVELTARRDIIRGGEKITAAVAVLRGLLAGDEEKGGILSDISVAASEAEKVVKFLPQIAEMVTKLGEARYIIEDVEDLLRDMDVDYNPEELDSIEARLEVIYKLSLKYGENEWEILNFLTKCEKELHTIEFADEERERLGAEYEKEKEKAISLAKTLSTKRKEAAEAFSKRVGKELTFLNMPSVRFHVNTQRVPLYSHGCDKMQFYVSVNKGEEPKPMSKIASGGEISRIMLAIKTVLAEKDTLQTLIFDEIDAGISGEAANKVGSKLKEVSKNRQVLCITHLAQIAALADHHLFVEKQERAGRTYTDVYELDEERRVKELARIIGGNALTELKLDMAREMLLQFPK